jgi:hypothetical protein
VSYLKTAGHVSLNASSICLFALQQNFHRIQHKFRLHLGFPIR